MEGRNTSTKIIMKVHLGRILIKLRRNTLTDRYCWVSISGLIQNNQFQKPALPYTPFALEYKFKLIMSIYVLSSIT